MKKCMSFIIVVFLAISCCSCTVTDYDLTLVYDVLPYDDYEVITWESKIPNPDLIIELNKTYSDIEQMFDDADYVVTGIVEDIVLLHSSGEYSDENMYIESLQVSIDKNYKGSIEKGSLISVISGKFYYDSTDNLEEILKNVKINSGKLTDEDYEKLINAYENKTPIIKMVDQYCYIDSSVDDSVLLFLTDNNADAFSDKLVFPVIGYKSRENYLDGLSPNHDEHARNILPIGGYIPMGKTLGGFILSDGYYVREESALISNLDTYFKIEEVAVESVFEPEYIFSQFTD